MSVKIWGSVTRLGETHVLDKCLQVPNHVVFVCSLPCFYPFRKISIYPAGLQTRVELIALDLECTCVLGSLLTHRIV